jgi:hypothetical protein
MERFDNLFDPNIYGFNREQNMTILIQQIMLHSIQNRDIEIRYKLPTDANIHSTATTQYICKAKTEYTKLMNYIYHITNKTPKIQMFVVKYPTEDDPNPDIPFAKELNRHTVHEIKRVRRQIEETQQKIDNIKIIISDFIDPKDNYQPDSQANLFDPQKLGQKLVQINPSSHQLCSSSSSSSSNDNILINNITVVQDGIRLLENQIKCLKKMKEDYAVFDTLNIDLMKNETFLRKYRLKYDLYLKTLKLETTRVDKLPEDAINIIREYIGENHLNKVRERCIYKKHFPNGREDMKTALKSWKKEDLLNYGNQVFLKYNIKTECHYYRFRMMQPVRSWTKDGIIGHITRNTMLYTFPDFQRDIHFITKMLKDRRAAPRGKKKKPILPLTPLPLTPLPLTPSLHLII